MLASVHTPKFLIPHGSGTLFHFLSHQLEVLESARSRREGLLRGAELNASLLRGLLSSITYGCSSTARSSQLHHRRRLSRVGSAPLKLSELLMHALLPQLGSTSHGRGVGTYRLGWPRKPPWVGQSFLALPLDYLSLERPAARSTEGLCRAEQRS